MQGFAGFPDGKVRSVALPEPFFAELLPLVEHLAEMKVHVSAFRRLGWRGGQGFAGGGGGSSRRAGPA